jgi:hypothetical protein
MARHSTPDHMTEQAGGLAELPRYVPGDHWAPRSYDVTPSVMKVAPVVNLAVVAGENLTVGSMPI